MFARAKGPLVWFWLMAALGIWGACATATADKPLHEDHLPGVWHLVEPGETSVTIARRAQIPLEDFLEINGLRRDEPLAPGRPVFLLASSGATAPPEPEEVSTAQTTEAEPTPEPNPTSATPAPRACKSVLCWPLAAPRVSSRFGMRWGRPHEGIDMGAPIGTPVFAAAAGKVIYAGDQVRGYGNMVVLGHGDGMVTVYAHNSVLLVHTGDRVALGQEIARVGDTGRSTAPHLHFEVRRRDSAQDPMQLLPPLK